MTPDKAWRTIGIVAMVVLAVAVLLIYGRLHWEQIIHAGPLEYREGASLVSTQWLLNGQNPYSAQSLPAATNVYGILFNVCVYPWAWLFGNTFAVHRWVVAALLAGMCVLVYDILRRQGAGRWAAVPAVIVFYAILVSHYAVVARPDYLGMLLFLSCLYVTWRGRFSTPWLAVGMTLAILAFFTKPYFLLAIAIVPAYLFLQTSKLRGVIYFAIGIALSGLASLAIARMFPFYFYCTFTFHRIYTPLEWETWRHQFRDFSILHAGFLALIVAGAVQWLRRGGLSGGRINLAHLEKPLLSGHVDFFAIALLLGFVALMHIGRNLGAYLIYFVQLLSPFVIICGLHWCVRQGMLRVAYGGVALNLLILAIWAPPLPVTSALANDAIDRYLQGSRPVLVGPLLVHRALHGPHEFYSNGYSNYFNAPFVAHPDRYKVQKELYQQAMQRLERRILSQEFEYVFADEWLGSEMGLQGCVARAYRPLVRIDLPVHYALFRDRFRLDEGGFRLTVWAPRARPAVAPAGR
jgi:hypothetical protein